MEFCAGQVPQFLLEAGFGCPDFPESAGLIGVTQPRRVAAISTATRVAYELGSAIGETVGYQVIHLLHTSPPDGLAKLVGKGEGQAEVQWVAVSWLTSSLPFCPVVGSI